VLYSDDAGETNTQRKKTSQKNLSVSAHSPALSQ